ncbi:MAG: cache domain-containing protein [Deltaproteobacteria bacterium]|nr:cache domain-containing protein [Deltaproteobacteria bacterium]
MRISLTKRLFLGFLVVILTTSTLSGFVSLSLIDRSIVAWIKDKVRLDLRSASDVYRHEADNLRETLRISALSFFGQETFLDDAQTRVDARMKRIAEREHLDILTLLDEEGRVVCRPGNPGNTQATPLGERLMQRLVSDRRAVVFTEVLSKEDLAREGRDLADRAVIRIVPSPYLKSEQRIRESSGMAIVAAAPVMDENENLRGVLYGGRLLNNSEGLVDTTVKKIYGNKLYEGRDVGLATIFLSYIRISTTVKNDDGRRALGSLISEDVYNHVLKHGDIWISRPFAVNSRYVTAYEPIRDMGDQIVGMLSIGLLEDSFRRIQKNAFWSFLLITLGGLGLSLLLCYFLIWSAMKPVTKLVIATQRLAAGNLDEQVHLEKSTPEIATLGRSFNVMAQSIRERDRQLRLRAQEEVMRSERLAMIGQLAAGVAHEINNPLGSILLFNRLVLNKCPEPTVMRQNLERVEHEVKRCQNIVQALLEFARQRETKTESTDLNRLLDKTMALFENQPLFHNIELIRDYQEDLPPAVVDPAQIQQVFVNILMNAVDAMKGKGTLTLRTRSPETADAVEICFADTGCGMPGEVMERIFEPFYTTKGVGQGTGLGLSISYGIIQRHGGDIRVSSETGRGSLFIVTLPIPKRGT